jgi:hypothetical protein
LHSFASLLLELEKNEKNKIAAVAANAAAYFILFPALFYTAKHFFAT